MRNAPPISSQGLQYSGFTGLHDYAIIRRVRRIVMPTVIYTIDIKGRV